MGVVHAAEFRVLGPTAIEDYHAHLIRLDHSSRFPGDHRGVDAHCLDLVASGAILIGVYVKGVMRAGAEIVPDRTARRAEAAITVEDGFHERGFERRAPAGAIGSRRWSCTATQPTDRPLPPRRVRRRPRRATRTARIATP
jgi:hypothetical protein